MDGMAQANAAPVEVSLGATATLIFLVAGKQFAVDLARVERILDYRRPTRTPRRPPHVEGIIQHEGRYLPIMSLRKRLGVEGPGPANPAILLLTGIGRDPVVGVVVDQVLHVLSLPPDRLLLPPPRVFGIRAEFIRGVANAGGRPVVWLDESKLLTSAEAITLLA
jgi:purine-binding chemotaxis protein CheW